MSVGILHYWSYLAFHNNIKGKDDLYLEQILDKFQEGTIKTEKLSNNSVFSFRLNIKERVICTISKYQTKDCLVILEILPNHEYHKSKNLKHNNDVKLHVKDNCTIVAASKDILTDNTEQKLKTLPIICSTHIHNKTIILGNNQLEILNQEVYEPTIFKISGTAGSGKTTIAELLIYNKFIKNDNSECLYITKSLELVNSVKKTYQEVLNEAKEEQQQELPQVDFITFQNLYYPLIFDKLFREDNFQKYNEYIKDKPKKSKTTKSDQEVKNPSYQEVIKILNQNNILSSNGAETNVHPSYLLTYLKDKLYNIDKFTKWIQSTKIFKEYTKPTKTQDKQRIAQEIYEDIRKLNDKLLHSTISLDDIILGKKESYDHSISKEILNLYKKHLQDCGNLDLSLIDINNIDNDKQYDYIIVDEGQDFGKSELKLIKSLLNKTGSIYFFIDSNQSLMDDFNLTPFYIKELAYESSMKEYELTRGYRTPDTITELANKILALKRQIIGGSLNQESLKMQTIQSTDTLEEVDKPFHNTELPGYIGWLGLDSKGEIVNSEHIKILDILKKEAKESIEFAIIIPDNDDVIKNQAIKIFPEGIIYSSEEAKGLEFQKVILLNFFSGKYKFNYVDYKLLSSLKFNNDEFQSKEHFPKDIQRAKEKGKYSKFFSNLFIAVTRTSHSLYFIETMTKESDYFLTKFKEPMNKGQAIELETSSIEEIIEFIENNQETLQSPQLFKYCEKSYNKIQDFILTKDIDKDGAFQYLEKIKGFVENIRSQEQETIDLQKKVESLLISIKTHHISSSDSNAFTGNKNTGAIPKKKFQSNKTKNKESKGSNKDLEQSLDNEDKNIMSSKNIISSLIKGDINISNLTPNQLALKYNYKQVNTNILCLLLIKGILLEKHFKQGERYIKDFASKITKTTLNEPDSQNASALYYLSQNHAVLAQIIKTDPKFLHKITSENLHKIGPNGWAPIHYLYSLRKDNHLIYTKIKIHISKDQHLQNWINFIKKNGDEVEQFIKTKYTLLHLAAAYRDKDLIKWLINHGAVINQKDENGTSALMCAVEKGYLDVVEILVQNGANINSINEHDATPLHYAAFHKHIHIVKFLLQNGANVNSTNKDGTSALHCAAQVGSLEAIELLVEYNATIGAPDNDGFTPLYHAQSAGHMKIASYINDVCTKLIGEDIS